MSAALILQMVVSPATASATVAVSAVTVDRVLVQVAPNQTLKIGATVSPGAATNKAVIWSSADAAIAEVGSDGTIIGRSVGTTTVTVTTVDGAKTAALTVKVAIPVEGVSFADQSVRLKRGTETYLTANVVPSNATVKDLHWYSSDPSVVSIGWWNSLEANKVGSATITVVSQDGALRASVEVTVYAPVAGIAISEPTAILMPGETAQLHHSFVPVDPTDTAVTWTSTDASVATVSATGSITAVSVGTATISVTSHDGGKIASIPVRVSTSVESVSLDADAFTVGVGGARRLVATVLPSNASLARVTWSSSDPAVASVGPDGTVTGLSTGTSTITVTTTDGSFTATSVATVGEARPVTAVSLDETDLWMTLDSTSSLRATISPADASNTSITWSSADPSVATVDANGLIISTGRGTTTITATTVDGGFSASATIAVGTVTGVTVDPSTLDLEVDASASLTATVLPADAISRAVAWTSSDDAVATVSQDGVVTGIAAGDATITATTEDGSFTASTSVTVTSRTIAVEAISFDSTSLGLELDSTVQLAASIVPINASDPSVSWATSDASIADVDASGVVTAVATGRATITATTTDGGLTATIDIYVGRPVTGVSLPLSSLSMTRTSTTTFVATVTPADAANRAVVWSSSNDAVASVSPTGLVTAKSVGTATISVTTEDSGFVATTVVKVTTMTPPGAPTAPTATDAGSGGRVDLRWTAPTAPLSAPILGYRIEGLVGGNWVTVIADSGSSATTASVYGLTNGSPYQFRIFARNDAWWSGASAATTAVAPTGPPDAATISSVVPGNAVLTASFARLSGAATGGLALTYTVTATHPSNTVAHPTKTCTVAAASTATSCQITGLTNGQAYNVSIVASNTRGNGPSSVSTASSQDRTPVPVAPGAPTGVTASDLGTSGNLRVTWTAPSSDGGSAITGYIVERALVGNDVWTQVADVTSRVSNVVVTTADSSGLTNGTSYRFRVTARNYYLSGTASTASAGTSPTGRPNSTTVTSVSAGIGSLLVNFDRLQGVATGGQAVTYTVTATHPTDTVTYPTRTCSVASSSNASSCTIANLHGGQTYAVSIVASNGRGAASATTSTADEIDRTPTVEAPSAPTNVVATDSKTGGKILLTWSAPSSTGGAPIVGYSIESRIGADGEWVTLIADTGAVLTYELSGLANGIARQFRVTARNFDWSSDPSNASLLVAATGRPGNPVLGAVTPANGSLTVAFTRLDGSATGGLAVTYTVTATHPTNTTTYPTKTCTVAAASSASSCQITGLTNGQAYGVSIVASNTVGSSSVVTSVASSVSRTPVPGAPDAVTGVTVTDLGTSGVLRVAWTAPVKDGGSPLVGYVVQRAPADSEVWTQVADVTTKVSTVLSATVDVSGLVNGTTYRFRVIARNALVSGSASTPSAAVAPTGKPTAASVSTVTPGNGLLTVEFGRLVGAPTGGLAVTYTVTATHPTNATTYPTKTCTVAAASTATSCQITGLTNGQAYTVSIVASNTRGAAASTTSTATAVSRTPVAPQPGTPTGVAAVDARTTGAVTVSWTAGPVVAGATVTAFKVEYQLTSATAWTVGVAAAAANATTATVSGLTNGSTYRFRVTALAGTVAGAASANSADTIPTAKPATPTLGAVTSGVGQLTVAFTRLTAAQSGGLAVSYTVTATPSTGTSAPKTCTVASSSTAASCAVAGLVKGVVYTVTIVATNATGSSAAATSTAAAANRTPK